MAGTEMVSWANPSFLATHRGWPHRALLNKPSVVKGEKHERPEQGVSSYGRSLIECRGNGAGRRRACLLNRVAPFRRHHFQAGGFFTASWRPAEPSLEELWARTGPNDERRKA